MARKRYNHFNAAGEMVSLPFDQCPPMVQQFILKQRLKKKLHHKKIRKAREAKALALRGTVNPLGRR